MSLSLERQVILAGLPRPQAEFKFLPTRRFRFDLAWPDRSFAVEIDGGVWTAGRHTRGAGYERDCEKIALAMVEGWKVLRVTTNQVRSGQALNWIEKLL